MSTISNDQQLNGYKFSFNRVNPYIQYQEPINFKQDFDLQKFQSLMQKNLSNHPIQDDKQKIIMKKLIQPDQRGKKQVEQQKKNKQKQNQPKYRSNYAKQITKTQSTLIKSSQKKLNTNQKNGNNVQNRIIKQNKKVKNQHNKVFRKQMQIFLNQESAQKSIKPIKTNMKNTKQIFYNKLFKQNEKNRMLIDLYLRKTKFTKKESNKKCTIEPHQLKQNSKLNISQFVNSIKFSQTKESRLSKRQIQCQKSSIQYNIHSERKINYNQTQRSIDYSQSYNRINYTGEQTIQSQNKINCTNKGKQKMSKKSKSFRTIMYNKFIPYTSFSKQKNSDHHLRIKSFKRNIQKDTNIVKENSNLQTSRQIDFKRKNLQISTKNNKKVNELNIKTQNQQDLYNSYGQKVDSFLSSRSNNKQKFKIKEQNLRKKIGALKYRTPKVYLCQKYGMFKSQKSYTKIKLFTQNQQQNLIRQFYTNDIQQLHQS